MAYFRICLVLFSAISNALAFTPSVHHQSTSILGKRSPSTIIKPISTNNDLICTQSEQCFSRSLALQMATKLKFADDDNGMTNSTEALSSRAESVFPKAQILTIEMADHVPLGCTVEESVHEDDDFIFISKVTSKGNAETSGLKVGDVIVGVTGLFGDMTCTIDSNVETIKQLVGAVADEDPLKIQVARGTNVLERHESTIVELCSVAGANEKEVQECVVDFLAGGYDYENNVAETKDDADETVYGNDEDDLIDGMMNLWADEMPATSTVTEVIEKTEETKPKPKPWSSRSSGSGTWVRDPKTGKMRNIDA